MSRPRFISNLSRNLLDELHAKLIDSDFSNFDDLEAWLTSIGHKTSKSAIHRYAQDYRYLILRGTDPVLYDALVSQRVSAMQVASKFASDKDGLIDLSEQLLSWMRDV